MDRPSLHTNSSFFPSLTSYRGGYLFLLLSSSPRSPSLSYIHICSLHLTTTHVVTVIHDSVSQRYCLLVLDLLPSHIPVPSYLDMKRFLTKFSRGMQPKLPHTLVYYPNSAPISIQLIPSTSESKLGTALMIGLKFGVIQFFSFQLDGWEWKTLEPFNILHMHDQIGTSFKSLEKVVYHAGTGTLTWLESIEKENRSLLRCCAVPIPLRSALGIESFQRELPYSAEVVVSTLFLLSSLNLSQMNWFLQSTSPSSSSSCFLISSTQPQIPSPASNESSDNCSLVSSISSLSCRSLIDDMKSSASFLNSSAPEYQLNVSVIDYHASTFSTVALSSPIQPSEGIPIKIFSNLLFASTTTEYSFLVVQFQMNSTEQRSCYFYVLQYTQYTLKSSGSIRIHASNDPLLACNVSESNVFLLYESKNAIPTIYYLPISALLRHDTQVPQWLTYKIPFSCHGNIRGMISSICDAEWTSEVKRHYYHDSFQTCMYTDIGELVVLKGLSTSESTLNSTSTNTSRAPLREITDKLLLTNRFLNPNPPILPEIQMDRPYTPHKWYQSYSNPRVELQSLELITFENSIITVSGLIVLPSHETLSRLKRRDHRMLKTLCLGSVNPSPISPTLIDSQFLYQRVATIFAFDSFFLESILNRIPKSGDARFHQLAEYFLDIDGLEHSSNLSLPQSSIRYLDMQELFISCTHKTILEEHHVNEEYLELSLWYLFMFQPSCFVNFVYEILTCLSTTPRSNVILRNSVQVSYPSLGRVNKSQRIILSRCFTFLDSILPSAAGTMDQQESKTQLLLIQGIYLTICSFSDNSVERIITYLCQWNYWNLAVEFACLIFTEYNTERVRHILGERWNNMSPKSSGDTLQWDNSLDKFVKSSSLDDDDHDADEAPSLNSSQRVSEEDVVEGDEWNNTWKDVSGSDTDPEDEINQENHVDEEYSMSQLGDSTIGFVWEDVESDEEEESELICWKYFTKSSCAIYLTCLKGLLQNGEISLACQLISSRPYPVQARDGERRTHDGCEKGIQDMDIIRLFEEIYQEQILERNSSSVKKLDGEDLRRCIDSIVYCSTRPGSTGDENNS